MTNLYIAHFKQYAHLSFAPTVQETQASVSQMLHVVVPFTDPFAGHLVSSELV